MGRISEKLLTVLNSVGLNGSRSALTWVFSHIQLLEFSLRIPCRTELKLLTETRGQNSLFIEVRIYSPNDCHW